MKRSNYSFNRKFGAFLLTLTLAQGLAQIVSTQVSADTLNEIPLASASYSTPVPPELASFASFPLPDLKLKSDGVNQTVSYRVPSDLDGANPTLIEMTGPVSTVAGAFTTVEGPFASASCSTSQDTLLCMVRYKRGELFGQNSDQTQGDIQSFLDQKYAGSSLLIPKKNVAVMFGNEPAGIIRGVFKTE